MLNRFDKYSDDELVQLFHRERKNETATCANIIILIDEVERRRFYMKTNNSIYAYLKDTFQYSKEEAYPRIKAAKAYAIEPSVEAALRNRQTCITHLRDAMIAITGEGKRRKQLNEPKLTKEDQQRLIRQIIQNGEASRTIAEAFPKLRPEVIDDRPLAGNRRMISFGVSQEQYDIWMTAKDLLSNKFPDAKWPELITEFAKVTAATLKPKAPKTAPNETPTNKQRGHIPANTIRHLHDRSGGQCEWTYASTGARCGSKHQLEIEHHVPIAKGGTDSYTNLKLYCRAHNQYAGRTAGIIH